ncbi:hypothetical protein ACOME3_001103 [Neoechinorhynchus agilis]
MKRPRQTDCKYGVDCYRTNPNHLARYSHPTQVSKRPQRQNHFGLHYSKVDDLGPACNTNAMSLQDILNDCHEIPMKIWFFNYMIDVPWVCEQLPSKTDDGKPELVFVHDVRHLENNEYTNEYKCEYIPARMVDQYGVHHSKMIVLRYERTVRIVILTANFIEFDWDDKTQMIWKSDYLSFDDTKEMVDSNTKFGEDMIDWSKSRCVFLKFKIYRKLDDLIGLLKHCDFSSIRVYLVASVPGRVYEKPGFNWNRYGLRRMKSLLSEVELCSRDRLIAQFSSIGSLGKYEDGWLLSQFAASLWGGRSNEICREKLDLVFPTVNDIRRSLRGLSSGQCVCYTNESHKKQMYLNYYFRSWRADRQGRTRATPHCKSYLVATIEDKSTKLKWFLMTSANLSKSAWGTHEKNEKQFFIRSYELGVLFLPRQYNLECFDLDMFPVPFDIPCKKYEPSDEVWRWDIELAEERDTTL